MHLKSNCCLFVDFVVLCRYLKEQIWLVVVFFMFFVEGHERIECGCGGGI